MFGCSEIYSDGIREAERGFSFEVSNFYLQSCCTANLSSRRAVAEKSPRLVSITIIKCVCMHIYLCVCAFGINPNQYLLLLRIQVVREHYLRDDIYCGASICKVCDSKDARLTASPASPILVIDTNVVLNQVYSYLLLFVLFTNVITLGLNLKATTCIALHYRLIYSRTRPLRMSFYYPLC